MEKDECRRGILIPSTLKLTHKHAAILFKGTFELLRDSDSREQTYVRRNERVVSIKTFLFSYWRSV